LVITGEAATGITTMISRNRRPSHTKREDRFMPALRLSIIWMRKIGADIRYMFLMGTSGCFFSFSSSYNDNVAYTRVFWCGRMQERGKAVIT
jgi:hypothetical protein